MDVARQVCLHGVRALSSINNGKAAFDEEFPSANFRDLCTRLAGNLRVGWEVSVHVGGWDNVPQTSVGGGRREPAAACVF